MRLVSADAIGSHAERLFRRPSFAARVLGVTREAIYLESDEGEVLWLLLPCLALHRRCVQVRLAGHEARPGEAVWCEGGALYCGARMAVAWATAPVWETPGISHASRTATDVADGLAVGLGRLLVQRAPRGIGALVLPGAVGTGACPRPAVESMSDWLDSSVGSIAEVMSAVRARDGSQLLASAGRLVGLGEGLTPSGDDFLGGLLFGLFARERAGLEAGWLDWDEVEAWVTQSAPRTSQISHTILADLARGHGPRPLHDLATAVLAGRSPDVVAQQAAKVIAIGHTSGWDLLAGFTVGYLPVPA